MSEQSTETVVSIEDYFSEEIYSPYGVIKQLNIILKDLGSDKILPGPMGYTYAKKGYIRTIEGTDSKKISREAAIEWIESYLAPKPTKAAKVTETEKIIDTGTPGVEVQ